MNGPQSTLRLGFAGTPSFAAHILERLLSAERAPVVVYTQPDRPMGRGRRTQPSPVKTLALAREIPVEQPQSLKGQAPAAALAAYQLDLLIVAAYGLILPRRVLDVPRLGCINVHASLLPRWRGAAPIERAIMAGDTETGVCIMQMDAGLDTGPVYDCRRCPIQPDTDGPGLEQALADLGADALLDCLSRLQAIDPVPQGDTGITYAPKLTRNDAAVSWTEPALQIERRVRALTGRLPAFAMCDGTQLRILTAQAVEHAGESAEPGRIVSAARTGIVVACGDGALRITRLQLSRGKARAMTAGEALNGYGDLLGPGNILRDGSR